MTYNGATGKITKVESANNFGELAKYTITFKNGEETISETTYVVGDNITVPSTPNLPDGCEAFIGWFSASEQLPENPIAQEDKTYTAKWKKESQIEKAKLQGVLSTTGPTTIEDDLGNKIVVPIRDGVERDHGFYIARYEASYGSGESLSDLINSFAWDTALMFIELMGNSNYAYATGLQVGNTGRTDNGPCKIYDLTGNKSEWTTETADEIIRW